MAMFQDNDDIDMLASSEKSLAEHAMNFGDNDTEKTPSLSNLGGSHQTSHAENAGGLSNDVKKVEASYENDLESFVSHEIEGA